MYRVVLHSIEYDRGKESKYQHIKLPSTLTYELQADDDADAAERAMDAATDETGFCIQHCFPRVTRI